MLLKHKRGLLKRGLRKGSSQCIGCCFGLTGENDAYCGAPVNIKCYCLETKINQYPMSKYIYNYAPKIEIYKGRLYFC